MKAALPLALAASLTLAACVPSAEAPRTASTAPAARPAPAPRPAGRPPAAPAAPLPADPGTAWMDAPQTAGAWRYGAQSGGGMALFAGARGEPLLMLECDRETGPGVRLLVFGNGAARLATIRTETAARSLALTPGQRGAEALIGPRDPLLDAMALSKGRFAVEFEGAAPLYLPSWAEVSRVIEDCR